MNEATLWWVLTGIAVGLELVTGTFYLLMLSVGLVAAALAAHAGASLSLQFVAAAVAGGGAVAGWHLRRASRPPPVAPSANHDLNLDIGETVQVTGWNPDGTATVRHRGANWTALPVPGALPAIGAHRVREVSGSHLILEKI